MRAAGADRRTRGDGQCFDRGGSRSRILYGGGSESTAAGGGRVFAGSDDRADGESLSGGARRRTRGRGLNLMIEVKLNPGEGPDRTTNLEWLAATGMGGSAMGPVSGITPRRYHGALTAAIKPPLGRYTLVSKLEETLVAGGERFELGANRFPGTVNPRGFELLESFRLDPFPVWRYRAGGFLVTKRLFMPHGSNTDRKSV